MSPDVLTRAILEVLIFKTSVYRRRLTGPQQAMQVLCQNHPARRQDPPLRPPTRLPPVNTWSRTRPNRHTRNLRAHPTLLLPPTPLLLPILPLTRPLEDPTRTLILASIFPIQLSANLPCPRMSTRATLTRPTPLVVTKMGEVMLLLDTLAQVMKRIQTIPCLPGLLILPLRSQMPG